LDQLDDGVRDRSLLAVEADDETRRNIESGRVNLMDALDYVPPRILLFPHRDQRCGVGALDAYEDTDEVGLIHQFQEILVVGQIEGRLGRELERIVVLFEPRLEFGQECLDRLLVADQVVVDEVDMTAIAETIKRLQLMQHLRVGLGARDSPVELDNVAELAGERTAARELHSDVEIMLDLQEVEARDWASRYIDLELFGLEDTFSLACLPRCDELVDDALGFAE